jgi:hypothetical protein
MSFALDKNPREIHCNFVRLISCVNDIFGILTRNLIEQYCALDNDCNRSSQFIALTDLPQRQKSIR